MNVFISVHKDVFEIYRKCKLTGFSLSYEMRLGPNLLELVNKDILTTFIQNVHIS